MKRNNSGGRFRKEKIIAVASSVLVLAAMTVTGIYIYNQNQPKEPENNVVDFSALESDTSKDQVAQVENNSAQNLTSGQEKDGELDYDPYYAEKDRLLNDSDSRNNVWSVQEESLENQENTDESTQEDMQNDRASVGYAEISKNGLSDMTDEAGPAGMDGAEVGAADEEQDLAGAGTGENTDDLEAAAEEGVLNEAAEEAGEDALEAVADVMREEVNLHFSEDAKLEWPIIGNVLLNYSMDKTIFFPTLQQYKYNPSIIIAATQGANVASSADGVVKSVYQDPQTGKTIVMNLGDGYELSYGQLQDVMVEEGDFVEAGAFIGKVAAPTKYYTTEGTNVYFKLTKDGEPVNPLNYLG